MADITKILHSIYGSRFGLSRAGSIISDGRVRIPHAFDQGEVFRLYDHFEGPTLRANNWITKKGSDGSCAFPAHTDSIAGGRATWTTGADAGGTMALNGSQLLSSLQFDTGKAVGSMSLRMAVPYQLSRITSTACFIGYTDQNSALEFPATLAGGTLTTNFTDGYGFLFDSAATAATWKGVGVANDVDAAVLDTAIAPVAATDQVFVLDHDGATARFYIDGKLYGSLAGCSRNATLLTPTIALFSRSAVSMTGVADYINAEQPR